MLPFTRHHQANHQWLKVKALATGAVAVLSLVLLLSSTAHADDMPTFNVLMKNGKIIPVTIEAPANTRFRLVITNEGPGAAEFESLELRKELVLAPGVSRNMVFNPTKPGTYKIFDDFHQATGQAQLILK